jgi:ketosteroid isomerase-like protein
VSGDPATALAVARRVMGTLPADVDLAADVLREDVEWYGSVGGLEPGLARGREAVRAAFEAYRANWQEHGFEEKAAVVSGERVLLLVREWARGRGSGVGVEHASAGIITVVEGEVAHVVTYLDVGRALADFGIPEPERAAVLGGGSWELRAGRLLER